MAEEAALSICKFTESQKQELRKLDEKMKKKWNIQLRWDSKVPENDKWIFYFFTLRGLNTSEISETIKKLETDFKAINEDMRQITEGRNVSQERIESIRKRFEKVLGEMEMLNKSTDSSSLYDASRNALLKKDDVLRCFDHVEIVQSRRELPAKKQQLDHLKRNNENKDETIITMSKVYEDYVQKEQKNEDIIDILENQVRVSQENCDEYRDLTNELMRRINPMLVDCNVDAEEGRGIFAAVETNMLAMGKVFDVFNFYEDSKDKEWKYEERLVQYETKLEIYSLKILQRILKLSLLLEEVMSNADDDGQTGNKLVSEESKSDDTSSDDFDVSELRRQSKEESKLHLEHYLTLVIDCNREFRGDSEELMKLMNNMLPDTVDLKETKASILQTVIETNEYMKNKLIAVHKLFEDFNERELNRNDKVENLSIKIRTKFEQILGEIHKIKELVNTVLQRTDQNN